jgi:subtilase family serine protease
MDTTHILSKKSLVAIFIFLVAALRAPAQTGIPVPQITQPIDETKLAVLHGNTHPLARAQYDRGAAPGTLQIPRMLLVLKRSPAQEAALETLLAEQQDKRSPNYHHWLTPQEFGEQFGVADQDIQTISSWLESHGFHVNKASPGRMTIDFSGTIAQVQEAFHTSIHQYVVNGVQHMANSSDPSIPIALTPVVAGVRGLHNFYPKPQSRVRIAKDLRSPAYTFPAECSLTNPDASGGLCDLGLGPADFDKIYNVPSSLTGAGETIAIVSDSDIQVSNGNLTQPTDVNQFRTIFGLPAIHFLEIETDPANDPGVLGPDSDEVEAVLDSEWSGAIATGAQIDLVVSASPSTTPSTFGGDVSAEYIVDNTNSFAGSSPAPILSFSYGECELGLGNAGNQFYNNLWQQAAGEGITVLVSSGDDGSAACDLFYAQGPASQPAQFGLEVNGIASTPYNVSVGGTDFNDVNNPQAYWGTTNNATTQQSVLGYVPEMTWNDTCTNSVIYSQVFGDSTALAGCNDIANQDDLYDEYGIIVTNPVGGSGGMSSCTTSDGQDPSSCSGGYAKPTWQTGPGVPNDGKRDLPDISMFAGDGLISGSFYVDCEEDYVDAPCSLTANDYADFLEVGGTSVSAQVMAGITALIDQKTGSRQGLLNPTLYSLGSQQSAASCNSMSPATSCVFNDVTVGTIEMPCASGTTNCSGTGAENIGILTGYNAETGYDLATGLGSVNVGNLANAWGPTFYISSSSPSVTVSSQGGSGNFNVTVAAVNGFTGTVTLACSGLPTGASCSFSPSSSAVLTATTTSVTIGVMVTTTAPSEIVPASWTSGDKRWAPGRQPIALALIACAGLLMIYFAGIQRRWGRTALALVAFSALIAVAGCGGGGGGGGGGGTGGTPTGTTVVSVTGANGNVQAAMTFTLTVQ